MMNARDVLVELERLGTPQTRKTWARHGCPEPFFGVKVGDMKTLVKKIRTNTPLARELFATGNGDAMYLAGLVGRGHELTADELDGMAAAARWSMISEFTVPWLAVEHPDGWKLGLRWIDSKEDHVSACGWATLGGWVATRTDDELDLAKVEKLLARVVRQIQKAPNRTRYTMNGFVIAVGCYVRPLAGAALEAAAALGTVEVDMGDTACNVPDAAAYIDKVAARGAQGKKRKTMRC